MPISGEILEQPPMSACVQYLSTGRKKTFLPKRSGHCSVGVKRVDAIVFGGDIHHIVHTQASDIQTLHIERFRVNLPVHRVLEKLAELSRIHIPGGEDGFIQVLPRAAVVIVIHEGSRIARNHDRDRCRLGCVRRARSSDAVPSCRAWPRIEAGR